MKGVGESGIKFEKRGTSSVKANPNSLSQAYARNVLILSDGFEYHEPYILPDTNTKKSTRTEGSFGDDNLKKEQHLKLYPNPAHDYLTIEFDLPYSAESIIAEIVTIQGKPVEIYSLSGNRGEKIIDMRRFLHGTYLVRLWANGIVLGTSKFVKK